MTKVDYKSVAQVVAQMLSDYKSADVVKSLAAYLVQQRRANELDKIMREVARIRHDDDGVLEVNVSTARELSSEVEEQIRQMFSAKKIIINKEKDTALVGGVKIQAQDTLLDLSVRGQLNKLKAHKF